MYNQHKIYRVLQLISTLKKKPAKTIRHLSELLETTERTTYRYLDLLEQVGFHVSRDQHNRVFIEHADDNSLNHFTAEENELLKSLLLTVGKKTKLRDGILQKLSARQEHKIVSNHLLKAHLGKIIEQLATAMQSKKQVTLKKYHSVNSNSVNDRLVEPVSFTDNYQSLVAFEPASQSIKHFNIERISAVQIRKSKFLHAQLLEMPASDPFGFTLKAKQYDIELLMNVRCSVLMREQFPMTAAYIKKEAKSEMQRFAATVYDLRPVTRFVLGFADEINVVGSVEFRKHLKEKVKNLLNSQG